MRKGKRGIIAAAALAAAALAEELGAEVYYYGTAPNQILLR